MAKASLGETLRYKFENTLSKGPVALIYWLGLLSVLVVFIAGGILVVTGFANADGDGLPFIEACWQSLMRTLDSGTMGGDEGWGFRVVMLCVTLGGIFIISTFIGALTSTIEAKLDELRKGRSNVLESNHTLILGWSSKVFSIISELTEANENQKNPAVVILADKDKVEMEDEIRSKIEDLKNTRVIVRSGSPLEPSDIEVVDPHGARSIIVLSPEDGSNADTSVIKSVLAITNGKKRKKEKYHIVAEIKDPANMEAADLVGGDEAVYVLSADLISRVTAQTCRQSGLSIVYSELLQFEGDELYFSEAPKLSGKTYKDALYAYETSSVVGLSTPDGKVLINPPMDTVIGKDDSVIAISEDDDTVVVSGKTSFDVKTDAIAHNDKKEVKQEKTLILGWNEKGVRIVEELDNYVSQGSIVKILAEGGESLENDIAELKSSLKNNKIDFTKGDIIDKATLQELKVEQYDHIILLSYTEGIDLQESDSKTLICLLHLRNFSEQTGKDFSIVSEMLDIRNRELAEVAKADDFIVSDKLVSLMLAQLSENKELKKVYDILFEADGSEFYLKPVSRYIKPGTPVNFYTILESAAELNESAVGYRIVADHSNSSKSYGVKINPNKSESITFSPNDKIIVLAED